MSDNNRICRTCGNEYYHCPACNSNAPSWKKVYDTEECMNAYVALAKYNAGAVSAKKAKEEADKCGTIVNEDLLMILEKANKELDKPLVAKFKNNIVNEENMK